VGLYKICLKAMLVGSECIDSLIKKFGVEIMTIIGPQDLDNLSI
jgi:hypothetical protein